MYHNLRIVAVENYPVGGFKFLSARNKILNSISYDGEHFLLVINKLTICTKTDAFVLI